jgi:hypothetical protein
MEKKVDIVKFIEWKLFDEKALNSFIKEHGDIMVDIQSSIFEFNNDPRKKKEKEVTLFEQQELKKLFSKLRKIMTDDTTSKIEFMTDEELYYKVVRPIVIKLLYPEHRSFLTIARN